MRCYCSICRKTNGGGGYAINIEADTDTLRVEGREHVRVYRAQLGQGDERHQSKHQRHFCAECGSHLWAFHEDWPHLLHPVASAIDTPLSKPSVNVHIMLGSRAPWAEPERTPTDEHFQEYPGQSLADFHDAQGWTVE